MSQGQLLVVDDLAQVTDQVGTMVLDQNLGASRNDYPAIAHHLLGPEYALLRRDFGRQRDRRATRSPEHRVLVTLGGDPDPDLLSRWWTRSHQWCHWMPSRSRVAIDQISPA